MTISKTIYEKLLDKSTDKETAALIMEELKDNMSEEKFNELESLFPLDVIKEVSIKSGLLETAFLEGIKQQKFNAELEKAEKYMATIKSKYSEVLENPHINALYNAAFIKFGEGLDSDWFFSKINDLKNSYMEEFQKSQMLNQEKGSAVDIASQLTPTSNAKGGTPLSERNALDMSDEELQRAVVDYFNRT